MQFEKNRKRGSILVLITSMGFLSALITGVILAMSLRCPAGANESSSRDAAFEASSSGIAFYANLLSSDGDVLEKQSAPHDPQRIGSAEFRLIEAETIETSEGARQVRIVIEGTSDEATYRQAAILVRGGDGENSGFEVLSHWNVRS